MTDTSSVLAHAKTLALGLRIEIYTQLFHVNIQPLLKLHEERELVKRITLPSLEVCRRDETYKSYRTQCLGKATHTGAFPWPDDAEEAFFRALDQLPPHLEQYPRHDLAAQHQPHHPLAAQRLRLQQYALAVCPDRYRSRCAFIANAIQASTGFSVDVATVSCHLGELGKILQETIQEAWIWNGLVVRLLAELRAVDGHRRHDFLYRFLDTEAVWHNFAGGMQGFEVLMDSCSVGFRRAIKSVRIEIPPSVVDVSRYLRPLMCGSRGVELRFLRIGFDSCSWFSLQDKYKKYKEKRWLEEMELFLDQVANDEIDVLLEVKNKNFRRSVQVYPTALLKRRGWRALKSEGHKWEASTEARR